MHAPLWLSALCALLEHDNGLKNFEIIRQYLHVSDLSIRDFLPYGCFDPQSRHFDSWGQFPMICVTWSYYGNRQRPSKRSVGSCCAHLSAAAAIEVVD